jgi:lipopolysaccharide heptosyltransferase II
MIHKTLKMIDRLIGSLLIPLFHSGSSVLQSQVKSILIIRPGGIGDAVLLLPMLQQLSTIYPDAKIEVLAERRNAEVFCWSPVVSKIWQYDKPRSFLKLFQQRYDLIIDTEQWYRLSAVVGRLLRPSRLVGFSDNERSRLLTDPCPYDQDEYEAIQFLRLLTPLTGNAALSPIEFSRSLLLPQSEFSSENPYIVIFPGASVAAKQWPAERFAEVARYCEQSGFDVVVVGGGADRAVGQVIVDSSPLCLNLAGKTSLTEAAAIVSGAQLVISGDSGLLHVAQLQGVPTVSLFGPSNPQKWCHKKDYHFVVSADCDCSPCSHFGTIPVCRHNYQCIANISVVMVIDAVERLYCSWDF